MDGGVIDLMFVTFQNYCLTVAFQIRATHFLYIWVTQQKLRDL